MQIARWAATALFVLAVPVFLVLTNVRVAALEPRVYGYSFSRYDAPAVTGVRRAQLDVAAREIVRYFRGQQAVLAPQVTVGGQQQALFNTRELLHMQDVRDLFRLTFRLHEVAFVYIIGYVAAVFLWSRERSLRRLATQCITAAVVTVTLIAAAAAAVLAGFDTLFREFHVLSFANDLWELDPRTDHLVQMFPRDFWFDVTLAVGAAALLEAGLLAAACWAYLRWLNRREHMSTRHRTAVADGG